MLKDYESFLENLNRVQERIDRAICAANRREGSVRLLPVTKNHPVDAANFALRAGIPSVGENRVQEALGKIEEANEGVRWELIGPLQSNKAKKAVESFWRIQSVDRPKILTALQKRAEDLDVKLSVLLQINAGDDPNKSGAKFEDAEALMEHALEQDRLDTEGLMTIAPLNRDPSVARSCFARLRECRDRLADRFGIRLPELSMGMSGDLGEAILEGSTLVRVGMALYGAREYK